MVPLLLSLVSVNAAHAACGELHAEAKEARADELRALVVTARGDDAAARAEAVQRARALARTDGLCTTRDQYHAAAVLVKGSGDDLLTAFELAQTAFLDGIDEAGLLAAQAKDGHLVRQGKPQRYGVMRGRKGEELCLFPVDAEATDAERGALGLPPLDEVVAQLVDDAELDVEPTMAGLEAAGALCPLAGQAARDDATDDEGPAPADGDDEQADEPAEAVRAGKVEAVRAGAGVRDLSHGELYGWPAYWSGNAWTMGKGKAAVRPLMRSALGVVPGVDVKSSALGWLAGPNLHLEVAPVHTDTVAASIEGGGSTPWNRLGDAMYVYGEGKVSTEVAPDQLAVTGGLLVSYRRGYVDVNTEQGGGEIEFTDRFVKPKLGVELMLGSSASLVVHGRVNAGRLVQQGLLSGGGGGYFAYGRDLLGLSIGVNIQAGQIGTSNDPVVASLVRFFGLENELVVFPFPHAQLWFRL